MIVEPDYRGFRIQVDAVEVGGGRWDATMRVRRVLTDDKPHVEPITCSKEMPERAELSALAGAMRWIDRRLEDDTA